MTRSSHNAGNRNELDPAVVYRVIGMGLVAASSGLLVLLLHHLTWAWGVPTFPAGVVACVFVGSMFGVPAGSTLMTAGTTAGGLEGAYRGWEAYGLAGAVLGGPTGVAAGAVAVVVAYMAVCAVSIVCGVDPFVAVPDPTPRQDGEGADDLDR